MLPIDNGGIDHYDGIVLLRLTIDAVPRRVCSMTQHLSRLPVVPIRVFLIGALLLGTLFGLLQRHEASAQTHTYAVNSTADLSDATPGDDVCLTATNVCTLRAAIEEANHANHGADLKFITVYNPGTYTLSSQLVLTGTNINIYGTGDASEVIIDGGSTYRVFDIGGGTIGIYWVTIQNGRNEQSVVVPSHYHGGAIHNHGTLTLGDVIISDSVSAAVTGGTSDCITICGGGLYNANSATLDDVTLDGNQATLDGGGIHNGGTLDASNTTMTGNQSTTGTGAATSNVGTATVTHATIANNTTGSGGAIGSTGGTYTLTASIVANNTGGNCAGTITDGGYNISYPDTTCPGLNEDPLLDPAGLQDNGGPTPTIGLQASSPAIDLIPTGSCPLSTDQRGIARPSGAGCDAGAFEFVDAVAPTISASDITVNATSPAGAVVHYVYTVSDDVTPADQIVVECKNDDGVIVPSGSKFPIGMTTITCTATDATGNSGQTVFVVTVRGAADLIAGLRADTISLVGSTSAERHLVSLLDRAQARLAATDNFGAFAAVFGYTWQVGRYKSSGIISPATAGQLYSGAGLVMNALL